MILDSINRQLKNENYSLELESNPVKGLEKIEQKRYDLVLCDIRMKPINGTEVVQRLKANHPDLPVIVITGYVDDSLFDSLKKVGCDDFLIKPVKKTILIETVAKYLK
jgi:CheY-like chemotaxis protein